MSVIVRRIIFFVIGGLAATSMHAQAPATGGASVAVPVAKWDWTSSRKPRQVGDVLTVVLRENVGGTAVREQTSRANQAKDLDMELATPGGAVPMNGSLNSSRRSSLDETGTARRGVGLTGTFSVRIVAIGPGGLLQLKGDRAVDVDGNRQLVTLTAWARSEDVSSTNVIESTRLADAKIATRSSGTGKTGGGLVGKLVGWIWP